LQSNGFRVYKTRNSSLNSESERRITMRFDQARLPLTAYFIEGVKSG